VTRRVSPPAKLLKEIDEDILRQLLHNALEEPRRSKKGYKFENFFESLMTKEKGFKMVFKHSRSRLGEVDYVYRNMNRDTFWSQFTYICVECKNWKEKISSKETDHLISLIKDKTPLPCLGIFLTSTSFEKSAKTSIKNARIGDKILVVPFEGKNLEEMITLGFRASVEKKSEESIFKSSS
jgi:Holliday junction resolvase-like predicted endonuclease